MIIQQKENKVNIQQIPEEIKALKRWVAWKYTYLKGRRIKMPIIPGTKDTAAKINVPGTWYTFESAVKTMELYNHDGINFALSEGYTIIDFDDVGTEISPVVQQIIDYCDSYTERSPSGRGIHILLRGDKAQHLKNSFEIGTQKVEIYSTNHFMSVTGNVIQGRLTINDDSQCLLDSFGDYIASEFQVDIFKPLPKVRKAREPLNISDELLLEKARNSKSGATFSELWEATEKAKHRYTGDFALCMKLMFWTNGDLDRIDKLFRESNRYRDKWDKVHSSDGRTYGEMTIDAAYDAWDEVGYEPKIDRVISYSAASQEIFEKGLRVLTLAQGNGPAKMGYKKIWQYLTKLMSENRIGTTRDGQKYLVLGGLKSILAHIGGRDEGVIAARLRYLSGLGFLGAITQENKVDKLSPLIALLPDNPLDLGIFKYSEEDASKLMIQGVNKRPPAESKPIKDAPPSVKRYTVGRLGSARFTQYFIRTRKSVSLRELVELTGSTLRTVRAHLKTLQLHGVIEEAAGFFFCVRDFDKTVQEDRIIRSKLKVNMILSLQKSISWSQIAMSVATCPRIFSSRKRTMNACLRKLEAINSGRDFFEVI